MSNSGARLFTSDAQAIAIVSDTLSYDVEGAEFNAGFKLGSWNGKKTFLRFPDLVFEAGFVQLVKRTLQEAGYPVSINDTRTQPTPDVRDFDLIGITPRDYQFQAGAVFCREGRGIVQIATGGGKTEVAAMITKYLNKKTLFLTHKLDLVRQTRKRYRKRLGIDVGMISEGEWLPSDITVATVQTIMSWWRKKWIVVGTDKKGKPWKKTVHGETEKQALAAAVKGVTGLRTLHSMVPMDDKRETVKKLLSEVELLIVDEAHRSSGESFFHIITHCVNAYYRLSITATPLMKGNREADLRLIACSGDVIFRITNKELIDRGILAEPHFIFNEVPAFPLPSGKYPTRRTPYPDAYRHGIVHNELRNRMVCQDAISLVKEGRQTIVLVKEIEHGEILSEILRTAGVRLVFLSGVDDGDAREEALRKFSAHEIDLIVASTILDEGIDNDDISGLVLAGGGKSKISLSQRVGRAMRARKGEDLIRFGNTCRVFDYIDTGDHRLMEHSAQRYKAVKDEDGYVIDGMMMWKNRRLAA